MNGRKGKLEDISEAKKSALAFFIVPRPVCSPATKQLCCSRARCYLMREYGLKLLKGAI